MKINAIYKIPYIPETYISTGPKVWNGFFKKNNKPATLIAHPMWFFGVKSILLYKRLRKELKEKKVSLILMHNSKLEWFIGAFFGFKGVLLNQNMHTNEHKFKIISSSSKIYDAVYIAAAKPYKRIGLASKIQKLFIVTYFWPDVRDENGKWDLHKFEPSVSHADFNNDRIERKDVGKIINQSKVGLALSRVEGAMWASMEYLLSGLPVVSTWSLGGRDYYFDKRFVKVVRANKISINNAVQKLASQQIDPNLIRETTLAKIDIDRRRFYQYLTTLESCDIPYSEFHEVFWGSKEGIEKHRVA